MAFNSFGNAGASNVSQGPALPEVHTEGLGFLSVAGDAKVRLVTPWSPPPASNASLMSIASRRGLVAAAGPDAVVVGSTDSVRKSLEAPPDGDSEIRPFTPQLNLPLPFRICQLAFSIDEAYLVLSAEQGGGLAVYDVNALQPGANPAFEIPTNNEPLRALATNPSQEKAELCAVVTNAGKLLVASFKERGFLSTSNGQILKEGVSCVAWSNKGKQLVAGLGDGGMCQMTPEGVVKAEIPRPPELDSNYYVSSVTWLENDVFLTFHVSTSDGPQTKCHLITRSGQSFQYQTLNDPVEPYAVEKIPHHSSVRIRDFAPNLQDLLIFTSSATPDTGLIGRSKTPLAADGPVNVFANIELADDSRRATLPMSEDPESLDSPAAIGIALDLSSKDKVYKPIPTDELEQSPGPLPGYWVLNEQGILSTWWIVYSESIREGTTYSGLATEAGAAETTAQPQAAPFGASVAAKPAFGAPSALGATAATPAFGTPSALGATAAKPAFGGPSALGASASPWGSASTNGMGSTAFGSSTFGSSGAASASKPVFGSSSFGAPSGMAPAAPAFGQSTGLGAKKSPWASGGTAAGASPFGQSGFASSASSASGFSSFASQGGFAAVGASSGAAKSNIFASKGNLADISMDADTNTSFPPPSSKPSFGVNNSNPFGSQGFKLTSSFKPDTTPDDDDGKASAGEEKSLFGSGFAASMNEPAKTTNNIFGKSQTLFGKPSGPSALESTTPTATPAANKFMTLDSSAPTNRGPFSLPSSVSSGGVFGQPSGSSAPKTTPSQPPFNPFAAAASKAAAENLPLPPDSPVEDTATPKKNASLSSAAPLPPDPVKNKAAYSAPPPLPTGGTTAKVINDAPMPPDPVKNKAAYSAPPPLPIENTTAKVINDAPMPPDPVKNKKAYPDKLPSLPGIFDKNESSRDAAPSPVSLKQTKAEESKLPASPVFKSTSVTGPGFTFPSDIPPISDSDDDDLEEDEDEEEEEEEEDEEDEEDEEGTEAASEGSGVDVAKDLSPSSAGANQTPNYTPQGSFDEGLGGSFSTISRPEPDRRGFLFGPKVPSIAPPNDASLISPSLGRSSVSARRPSNDHTKLSGAPGMASKILGASKKQSQPRLSSSIVSRDNALENVVMEQQRKAKAKKEAEEAQMLVDEEDDAVQQILQANIEPTLELHEFIAHPGVRDLASDSVPAQVEALYRDINSMIDSLGLNSRSLKAWIDGHVMFKSGDRSKQALTSPKEWTLQDSEQLAFILDHVLGEALDDARVIDVEDKVAQIQVMQRDFSRDFAKQGEIRKVIASRQDPDASAAYDALPLSAEQAAQQSDLRRQLGQFHSLLAQAEEDLTMLKAKIVSAHSATGRAGPMPTVDAIVRTITKMTNMVEKRSGDVDVLENQMRKLRLSVGPGGSREGSPFATPTARRTLGSSIFSPDRSVREATPMRASILRNSLSASVGSTDPFRSTPRKKLSGYNDAERKAVREQRAKRGIVLGKLRKSLEAKERTIVPMDDIA